MNGRTSLRMTTTPVFLSFQCPATGETVHGVALGTPHRATTRVVCAACSGVHFFGLAPHELTDVRQLADETRH
jgi:hypothetical protein